MYYPEGELDRFVSAQKRDYAEALSEIKNGRKTSHWMWYIFPQIRGLGFSSTAYYYGIKDLEEAMDFMEHPYLGKNLIEISSALLTLPSNNPTSIFGYPDDLKLCSSMTLFEQAATDEAVFGKVLDKFYDGQRDERTLEILGR